MMKIKDHFVKKGQQKQEETSLKISILKRTIVQKSPAKIISIFSFPLFSLF